MRELIYYVATTADGFIAQVDGSFEGFTLPDEFGADLFKFFPETLPAPMHNTPLTKDDHKVFDAVLMGRKTYEVGLVHGLSSPYPSLDQYVVSRSIDPSPGDAVTIVKDDLIEFVTRIKTETGKAIWLCGGGDLASQLLNAGLIDELIIKLNPVLFGNGIPLFRNKIETTELKLVNQKSYRSGHQILFYEIVSY